MTIPEPPGTFRGEKEIFTLLITDAQLAEVLWPSVGVLFGTPMPLSLARRLVKIGLALLLLGVATAAGIFLGTESATRSATVEVMRFIGFVVAGVGLLLAWIGWRALRLARPANTIARWIIPPDQ